MNSTNIHKKTRSQQGVALGMALAIIFVVLVLLPAIVIWIQQDTKMSVKDQKSALAFNLAEAGIDRGMWKLRSSTETFAVASSGTVIAGYDFDTVYSDISGGRYRIKFSSGPNTKEVTVLAEGRDLASQQVRAIRAVFKNNPVPGGLITGGMVDWRNAFSAHWGPILAHGDITISDSNAAQDYFPRKYSRQVVSSNSSSYSRDTNGLDPPNTDNQEWWSDYPVPELPVLNFESLENSAKATLTRNIVGCSKTLANGWDGGAWPTNCNGSKCPAGGDHSCHFQNTYRHPLSQKNYVWYWDQSFSQVQFTGGSKATEGNGLYGTVIVRGTLINQAEDGLTYTGTVPTNAWQEYTKISKTAGDTAASNEYPGDAGYQKVNSSGFKFGTDTWTGGQNPPAGSDTDIGIRGFLYVGGDLEINDSTDIHGAVWVVGNVNKATGKKVIIFYDDTIDIPTLNMVLTRSSWNEVIPTSTTW